MRRLLAAVLISTLCASCIWPGKKPKEDRSLEMSVAEDSVTLHPADTLELTVTLTNSGISTVPVTTSGCVFSLYNGGGFLPFPDIGWSGVCDNIARFEITWIAPQDSVVVKVKFVDRSGVSPGIPMLWSVGYSMTYRGESGDTKYFCWSDKPVVVTVKSEAE